MLCRLTQKREVYCKIRTVFLNQTRFITGSVRRPLPVYRTLLLCQAGTRTFALISRSAPLGHIPAFCFLHIPFDVPLIAQVAIEFKLTLGWFWTPVLFAIDMHGRVPHLKWIIKLPGLYTLGGKSLKSLRRLPWSNVPPFISALGVEVSYAWNTVAEECGERVEVEDMGYEVLQDISQRLWEEMLSLWL